MKNFSKNCTIDLVGSSYFWEELKKFSSYEEKKRRSIIYNIRRVCHYKIYVIKAFFFIVQWFHRGGLNFLTKFLSSHRSITTFYYSSYWLLEEEKIT